MGVNRVFLSGELGGKPEIKVLSGGNKVAKFALAVKDDFGEGVNETTWFSCEAWNKFADMVAPLKKGSPVMVEGKFKVEKWTDEESQVKIKYIVKVTLLDC